jgi:hypothetical protein
MGNGEWEMGNGKLGTCNALRLTSLGLRERASRAERVAKLSTTSSVTA